MVLAGYAITADGGLGKEVVLLEYVGPTPESVLRKVIIRAALEGFKGTAKERIDELGWEIKPIYMELVSQAVR